MHRFSFSEDQCLMMIYGNYDYHTKSASWINIQFPDKSDGDGYFEERKGIVKTIFFQPYYENGKDKIFLLTKTIPRNIPFDCHACLPLIGAAVFVRKIGHWEIEAQNKFIMYDGEYGELPVVKLISVGKNKFGLSLEFEHIAVGDRELNIFIPYKNTIVNAHKETIYSENFNDCEFSEKIPCEAYTANFDFDKSTKTDFFDFKIKRFGTVYNDKRKKTMPVNQEITYQLVDGKYVVVSQEGEEYENERKNDEG